MMMAVVVSMVTNVPGAKAYRVIQKSDDYDNDDGDDDGDDEAHIEWCSECRFSGVRSGYGCVVGAWGCLGLLWICLNCLGLHLIV